MKTNGLRNKKVKMARAAVRCTRYSVYYRGPLIQYARCVDAVRRWHRAVRGPK
jgi:hypothetical protein